MEHHGNLWKIAGPVYNAHRRAIRAERSALEIIAARRFRLRNARKKLKKEIFRRKVESTFKLFARGLSVQEIATTLNVSIRTAYRRKAKFLEMRLDH
jgi:DNA-binding NarL/FixJ family response regulator